MRRILVVLLSALTLGCGSDVLGPVTSIDGHWAGIQNGYSISFSLTQDNNTAVTGTVDLGGISGFAHGTVTGTFVYPAVDLTISIPTSEPIRYTGTMSATEARIDAKLNGSGFVDQVLNVTKRKD